MPRHPYASPRRITSIPIRAVLGLALALDIELVFGIVDRSEAAAFMVETAHETCCSHSAAFVPVLNIIGTKEKPPLSVRHAALIRNGAINCFDCVLDKNNGLTHIFFPSASQLKFLGRVASSEIREVPNFIGRSAEI
jgi:hypothetical protein